MQVGSLEVVRTFAETALGVITSTLGPEALSSPGTVAQRMQRSSPGHALLARATPAGVFLLHADMLKGTPGRQQHFQAQRMQRSSSGRALQVRYCGARHAQRWWCL